MFCYVYILIRNMLKFYSLIVNNCNNNQSNKCLHASFLSNFHLHLHLSPILHHPYLSIYPSIHHPCATRLPRAAADRPSWPWCTPRRGRRGTGRRSARPRISLRRHTHAAHAVRRAQQQHTHARSHAHSPTSPHTLQGVLADVMACMRWWCDDVHECDSVHDVMMWWYTWWVWWVCWCTW